MPVRSTRIIVRVVKSPVGQRGEILVVLPESRTLDTLDVLAYTLVGGGEATPLIEDLRHLMDRTRAATPHVAAEARRQFEYWYGEPVQLAVKANLHKRVADAKHPKADEPPADPEDR
jgi:hypothetical protein